MSLGKFTNRRLLKQKEDLKDFLKVIAKDYKSGDLTKRTYERSKASTERELRDIEAKLHLTKNKLTKKKSLVTAHKFAHAQRGTAVTALKTHAVTQTVARPKPKAVVKEEATEKSVEEARTKSSSDDRPIGEVLEEEESKERQELQEDIMQDGAIEPGQSADNESMIDKLKKAIKSDKKSTEKTTAKTDEKVKLKVVEKSSGSKVSDADLKELAELRMTVEKQAAQLEAIKERGAVTEERLHKITGDFGEIRSISMQKEKIENELDLKVKKLEDMTEEISPEKISLALSKMDQSMTKTQAELDKIATFVEDLETRMNESQDKLSDIGSIKTIIEESKNVRATLAKIDKQRAAAERSAEKAEGIFVEVGKRLDDFALIEEKIDSVDSLTKELTRLVDKNAIKIDSSATKKELDLLKSTVNKLNRKVEAIENLKKEIEAIKSEMGDLVLVEEGSHKVKAPAAIGAKSEFEQEREEIEELLATIKEDFESGEISKEAYEEARKTSEEALKEIDKKIELMNRSKSENSEAQQAPIEKESSEKKEEEVEESEEDSEETGQAAPIEAASEEEEKGSEAEEKGIVESDEKETPKKKEKSESEALDDEYGSADEEFDDEEEEQEESEEEIEYSKHTEVHTMRGSAGLVDLKTQKERLSEMLPIVQQQFEAGLISESQYYEIEGRVHLRLRTLNTKLIGALKKERSKRKRARTLAANKVARKKTVKTPARKVRHAAKKRVARKKR